MYNKKYKNSQKEVTYHAGFEIRYSEKHTNNF